MNTVLTKADKTIIGEISLPTSKSISNRVLIINALSYSLLIPFRTYLIVMILL